jgi:hypothetical protein
LSSHLACNGVKDAVSIAKSALSLSFGARAATSLFKADLDGTLVCLLSNLQVANQASDFGNISNNRSHGSTYRKWFGKRLSNGNSNWLSNWSSNGKSGENANQEGESLHIDGE